MDRHSIIIKKLMAISNDEWRVVQEKSDRIIQNRIKGKIEFGAHSEENLGMSVNDYYFQEALSRLYEGKRDWKYEKRSLIEEISRIINDIIGDEVDKYKRNHKKLAVTYLGNEELLSIIDESPKRDDDNVFTNEKRYQEEIDFIESVISGDDDLEILFLALEEKGMKYSEICSEYDWDKTKLYRLVEKLKRKVINKRNKINK